jgi:AraC-like DNA-binding protein
MPIYTYTFIKFAKDAQEKKWITYLWRLVFIFLFSFVLIILIAIFLNYDVTSSLKILALFTTLLIHGTTYFGIFKYRLAKDRQGIVTLLNNPKYFSYEYIPTEVNTKKVIQIKNTELLTLDNRHFQKLEKLCKNSQLYRDSTLNREKVAEKLGISAGYVSQLVNTITGRNFTNYINHYRVEAVKKCILDSEFENYSLLGIGLECGFTSKTTFYNAFKKVTGMTPNSYRSTHK